MSLADTLTTYKPFWQSKTLWTAVLFAVAPLCPPVGAFVTANPVFATTVLSGVFAVLRVCSHGKVTIN